MPQQERTHVQMSGDSSFGVSKQMLEDHHRFPLSLRLEHGVTYLMNETTSHNAYVFVIKKRGKNQREEVPVSPAEKKRRRTSSPTTLSPTNKPTKLKTLSPTTESPTKPAKTLSPTMEKKSKKATKTSPPTESVDDDGEEEDDEEDDKTASPTMAKKSTKKSSKTSSPTVSVDDDDEEDEEDEDEEDDENVIASSDDDDESRRILKSTRGMQLVKRHSFQNHISLKLKISSDQSGARGQDMAVRITINDFIGYERTEPHPNPGEPRPADNTVDDLGESSYAEVFQAVRSASKGLSFNAILKSDGTFREMHTGELRRTILNTLHRKGLLPVELEHVVQLGAQVFRANGASFNPPGKSRVEAQMIALGSDGNPIEKPAYETISDGCGKISRNHKHKIIIVKRGGCTFLKKARRAAKAHAAALIVIDEKAGSGNSDDATHSVNEEEGQEDADGDDEAEEEVVGGDDDDSDSNGNEASTTEDVIVDAPSDDATAAFDSDPVTYMGGLGSVPILSVIVTRHAGTYLLNQIATSTNPVKPVIRGGAEAVLAYHNYKNGKTIKEADDDEDTTEFREEHLGLEQGDGLYDIVGVNFVVDEVLSSRFNIFPAEPVAVGDSWKRTRIVNSAVSAQGGSEVNELFRITSAQKKSSPVNGIGSYNDMWLTVEVHHTEKPVAEIVPDKKSSAKSRPIFVRASADGQEIAIDGELVLHAPTGFVVSGTTSSLVEWDRELLLKGIDGEETIRQGHVQIQARTVITGEAIRN